MEEKGMQKNSFKKEELGNQSMLWNTPRSSVT